jgi:hypothetical protein
VVYGGLWWCVPYTETLPASASSSESEQTGSGAWWCTVVYGGVSRACWCTLVSDGDDDSETLPGSTSSSEPGQTPAMYNTESLPDEAKSKFKATETKKYRDYVCSHYKLRFVPVAGNGNCFFLSVAMLLDIDPGELRQELVEWLRQCGASPDPVSQDCYFTMQKEVQVPLPSLVGKKWISRSPATVLEYLQMSSEDGVWVAGRISPNTAIHHLTTGTTFAHTPPHRHIQERTGYTRSQRFTRFVLPW